MAGKGIFYGEKNEFSLSNPRSLVSPCLQGARISKMMGRTELKLLEAMFPNKFPTVGVFQGRKWPEREFSMEKKRIFSVKSSFSRFFWPSG